MRPQKIAEQIEQWDCVNIERLLQLLQQLDDSCDRNKGEWPGDFIDKNDLPTSELSDYLDRGAPFFVWAMDDNGQCLVGLQQNEIIDVYEILAHQFDQEAGEIVARIMNWDLQRAEELCEWIEELYSFCHCHSDLLSLCSRDFQYYLDLEDLPSAEIPDDIASKNIYVWACDKKGRCLTGRFGDETETLSRIRRRRA